MKILDIASLEYEKFIEVNNSYDFILNLSAVEVIALECCHDTLDSYIVNNKIKDDEWESIISQIIFSLISLLSSLDLKSHLLRTIIIFFRIFNNSLTK